MKYVIVALSMGLALCFTACREDIAADELGVVLPPPTVRPAVPAQVSGTIVDRAGQAVAGAWLRLGQEQTWTNGEGYFYFPSQLLRQSGSLLRVEHGDYFEQSSWLLPLVDARHQLHLQVHERRAQFQTDPSQAQALSQDGIEVQLAADNFVDTEGKPVLEEVWISLLRIEPEPPAMVQHIPGSWWGTSTTGVAQLLETYGSFALDFSEATGHQLSLAPGRALPCTLDIAYELRDEAPAELPLWHYDAEQGLWRERGLAFRSGNDYVGSIDRPGYWSVAEHQAVIELRGRVERDDGLAQAHSPITLQAEGLRSTYLTQTEANGNFRQRVPANLALDLQLFDRCGGLLYQSPIPPQTMDLTLPDISLTANSSNLSQVTGYLVDCDDGAIRDAQISWEVGGQKFSYELRDTNYFEFTVNLCGAPVLELDIINNANPMARIHIRRDAAARIDFARLSLCTTTETDFFQIIHDGQIFLWEAPFPEVEVDRQRQTIIKIPRYSNPDFPIGLTITLPRDLAESYPDGTISLLQMGYDSLWHSCPANCGFDEFVIEQFGGFGEPVVGSFRGTIGILQPSGQLKDQYLEGQFRIRRP